MNRPLSPAPLQPATSGALSLTGGEALPRATNSEDHSIPGNIAIWILIWAELTEFALFFVVLLVARAHNPELFSQGPERLNTLAGALNTLILITSSYCVARAMRAIKSNQLASCRHWLWTTLAMGGAYCLVKAWEYHWNSVSGLDSRTDIFYSLYYYLTFNHLLHVLVGICTIGWATARTHLGYYSRNEHEGLEAAACYWHMIDLVWIIIFPLLYVLG